MLQIFSYFSKLLPKAIVSYQLSRLWDMAEKQNPAELSSGQSTSKEAIQEIAQTVAQEVLSELKSTSTQQQDLASTPQTPQQSFQTHNIFMRVTCKYREYCIPVNPPVHCQFHTSIF